MERSVFPGTKIPLIKCPLCFRLMCNSHSSQNNNGCSLCRKLQIKEYGKIVCRLAGASYETDERYFCDCSKQDLIYDIFRLQDEIKELEYELAKK